MARSVNSCLKISLIIGNVLFMICGAAFLAIGVWITQQENFINKFLGTELGFTTQQTLAYVAIGMGVVTIFVSFVGCCGAVKENKCLLIMFLIFQLIVFIVAITCVAMAFMFKSQIYSQSKNKMTANLVKNYDETKSAFHLWNTMQTTFKCCAVETGQATVYQGTPWYFSQRKNANGGTQANIPDSCCKKSKVGCAYKNPVPSENQDMHSEGCWNSITRHVEKYSFPSLFVFFGAAFLLLVGMIFTLIIIRQISNLDGVLA